MERGSPAADFDAPSALDVVVMRPNLAVAPLHTSLPASLPKASDHPLHADVTADQSISVSCRVPMIS